MKPKYEMGQLVIFWDGGYKNNKILLVKKIDQILQTKKEVEYGIENCSGFKHEENIFGTLEEFKRAVRNSTEKDILELFKDCDEEYKKKQLIKRRRSMMIKYRKKPIIVEAFQLTDDWFDLPHPNPQHIIGFITDPILRVVSVPTSEGDYLVARCGDYIVKGAKGEFYLCKLDIFEKTYEEVKE